MPARPPLMKGRAPRMSGVWRRSLLAFLGFSAADFMTAGASETVSLAAERPDFAWLFNASTAEELIVTDVWVLVL